jgi:hypothetical protein
MNMGSHDHFSKAKRIADRVEGEGFPDRAHEVRHAIDDGRSGTEIFMQLRFYLAPLKDDLKIDLNARAEIAVLLDKINEALTR